MLKEKYNLAVVGATGAVGETIFDILAERQFPVGDVYALASENSSGNSVMMGNKALIAQNIAEFDFSKVDIALFSAGNTVSKEYVPKATKAKCIVIDNTSEFRNDKDVPLVVPEVNPEEIAKYKKRKIIANPNCSTIQMVVVLKPIYDAVGIKRINVVTYQSVSGAGKAGITELATQSASLLNGQATNPDIFSRQIAFNVIPAIDIFEENGYTKEEMKMVLETQKIFKNNKLKINPTAVRVPVFYGHSEAVHLETRQALSLVDAKKLLKESPGIVLMEDNKEFPTPVNEGAAHDAVFVGRIRQDISCPNGLNFWVVADNVRKGAALNAVQIAELLIRNYI